MLLPWRDHRMHFINWAKGALALAGPSKGEWEKSHPGFSCFFWLMFYWTAHVWFFFFFSCSDFFFSFFLFPLSCIIFFFLDFSFYFFFLKCMIFLQIWWTLFQVPKRFSKLVKFFELLNFSWCFFDFVFRIQQLKKSFLEHFSSKRQQYNHLGNFPSELVRWWANSC